MNNGLKIIGKGKFQLIKRTNGKYITYKYDNKIVKYEYMSESPKYYTAERLSIMLNKFIESFKNKEKL